MKKTLEMIYSLVTVFCLFYGFPMAFVYMNKDIKTVIIHLIIGGVGLLLLLIASIYLLYQKKNNQS